MKCRLLLAFVLAQAGVFTIASCGARTGLELGTFDNGSGGNGNGGSAGGHGGDGGSGGVPPIDASPPMSDAGNGCPVGGLTAFLLGQDNTLSTYDPETRATKNLGPLQCPSISTPWTLTAASSGLLYVVYEDWNIYEIDPRTPQKCKQTAYNPAFLDVGTKIGITAMPGDALYIYGVEQKTIPILARGDLQTFRMSKVGEVTPPPPSYPIDIRANAFGRMFGLSKHGLFVELDPRTAKVVAQNQTTFTAKLGSWALLTWNDDFYFFAGEQVSKYDVASNTVTPLGPVAGGTFVFGASAAPCIH
jgi:hypothetical protein